MGPEGASVAEMVVAVDERPPEPPSLRVRHGLQARRVCALFPDFVKRATDATVEEDWVVARIGWWARRSRPPAISAAREEPSQRKWPVLRFGMEVGIETVGSSG